MFPMACLLFCQAKCLNNILTDSIHLLKNTKYIKSIGKELTSHNSFNEKEVCCECVYNCLSVRRLVCPYVRHECVLFHWHGQQGRAGEALTLLSLSCQVPGRSHCSFILNFVGWWLCQAPLPTAVI